ncbi:hypothetical protein [Chitinophaga pinensis]|uniref:Uncharacterized protein n=1 Tax=Chitinophaga pinensis (strain ATCC 43595 / DSM 2588 / LMG 13176 / NBRC 15968 / NCIMB 11800 / UQM 2034) TaxID=485918 RepID=A0A979GWN4_CHIPD|nr:hypothetical protein [Chitinophaga pinensis]ACU60635.1 hypothetical protein Cpin_3168 [Chitinophaga pinensis DSM 2588]
MRKVSVIVFSLVLGVSAALGNYYMFPGEAKHHAEKPETCDHSEGGILCASEYNDANVIVREWYHEAQ